LKITTYTYHQLSKEMLYQIIRLRLEVFVLEQNCIYQDLDNKDQKAIHLVGEEDGKLIAYTRLFKKGDYFENASIGRVIVKKESRKKDYGKTIMQKSIEELKNEHNEENIEISAQKYLIKFYLDLGFKKIGEEYLEDNIPHIKMVLKT
tara:strand:- start:1682 stop:2125 length:444 start_codon:yes stop_codon:yes gene_type:complete